MALFRRRRPETRAARWGVEPPIPAYPGADTGGRITPSSSPEVALQVPAVWACVRLLADTVSMMPLHGYSSSVSPDTPQKIAPTPPFFTTPAYRQTMSEWLYQVMVSLLLRGNAYGRVTARDSAGRPSQIELVHPDKVRVKVDPVTGVVTYQLNGSTGPVWNADEVWHLRSYAMPGTVVGLSPIQWAAQTVGLARYAEGFGYQFFEGGSHPSGVLTTDEVVEQNDAAILKQRFRAAVNGREPVVLGLGVKWQPIQVRPDESQFLATQEFTVSQIARVFGVPAAMIGGKDGGNLTYANVEQRSLDFLTYSVQPWLRRLEDSLSQLLPDPAEHVRFDVESLVRVDFESKVRSWVLLEAAHAITPNELRARFGLSPMTPEQEKQAGLVPLTVGPTGRPTAVPGAPLVGLPAGDKPPDVVAPAARSFMPADDLPDPADPRIVVNNFVSPPEVQMPVYVAAPEVRNEITVQTSDTIGEEA